MVNLGEIVRRERRALGISQRSLARRAGTSQAAISRIEAGLEEPGAERFAAIMQSVGRQPEIDLRPAGSHRYERRQLAYELDRDPAIRVLEGIHGARFVSEIRGQAAA